MAAIDHSAYTPSAPALGLGDSIFSAFHRAVRAVRVQIAAARTRAALSKLTARQLADIGLDGADLKELSLRMAERQIL